MDDIIAFATELFIVLALIGAMGALVSRIVAWVEVYLDRQEEE